MICPRRDLGPPGSRGGWSQLQLQAVLTVPRRAAGLAIVAQAKGSPHASPFQRALAEGLRAAGLATCLVDLIDPSESGHSHATGDLDFLAQRLENVMDFLATGPDTWRLPLGLVGLDAAVPAVLTMAAERPDAVRAAVCCGGRPDAAPIEFARLDVPTLLVTPSGSPALLSAHEETFLKLRCTSQLAVIRGDGRRLGDPGPMTQCERLIRSWCQRHLRRPDRAERSGSRLRGHDASAAASNPN